MFGLSGILPRVLPFTQFYPGFTQLPRVKLGKTVQRFYPPTLIAVISSHSDVTTGPDSVSLAPCVSVGDMCTVDTHMGNQEKSGNLLRSGKWLPRSVLHHEWMIGVTSCDWQWHVCTHSNDYHYCCTVTNVMKRSIIVSVILYIKLEMQRMKWNGCVMISMMIVFSNARYASSAQRSTVCQQQCGASSFEARSHNLLTYLINSFQRVLFVFDCVHTSMHL